MNQSGSTETRPRICLFTETFHPVVGGGETQSLMLAEGLSARGYRVLVLTRRSARRLPKRDRIGSVDVRRLPPSGEGRWKKWFLILTSVPALIGIIREVEIVLVSGYRIVGASTVLICRAAGKRCILKSDSPGEFSGEFFRRGLQSVRLSTSSLLFRAFVNLRNRLLSRANAFVSISSPVRSEFVTHGIERDRIRDIPNGIDMTIFREATATEQAGLRLKLGIDEHSVVAVYTGRLVSYKGLPLLLEVWDRLVKDHPEARLILVGTGGLDMHNCESELRSFVAGRGLHESVVFTGPVSNVQDYLRAADYFVFPTETEAFGISLVEAMACGLPVVTTLVGGIRDFVRSDENGLTVDVGDADGLYAALDRITRDDALRRRLGQSAQRSVRDRFSLTSVIDRYEDLFVDLMNEENRRPRSTIAEGVAID